jgi:hypothetical protein
LHSTFYRLTLAICVKTATGIIGPHAKIEYEQRHSHGEDAVAERGQAFDALSGNAVMESVHRKEFSGLPKGRQKSVIVLCTKGRDSAEG